MLALGCTGGYDWGRHVGGLPRFPTLEPAAGPSADYDPRPCGTARWALPRGATLRVWVKGSARCTHVALGEGATHTLSAPYYTAVLDAPSETIEARFFEGRSTEVQTRLRLRFAGRAADFASGARGAANGPFSVLAYGCFQPFGAERFRAPDGADSLRAVLASGTGASHFIRSERECEAAPGSAPGDERSPCPNYQIRRLLRSFVVAPERLGSALIPPDEPDDARHPGRDADDFALAYEAGALPAAPIVALADGDQVYVDAGYASYPTGGLEPLHPLSAWRAFQPDPELRLRTPLEYRAFFDGLYRGFASFRTLEDVFARVPVAQTWDDHDIRDGWGSHGDEARYAAYFAEARRAFVAHQLATGPRDDVRADGSVAGNARSLEQTFTVRGVPVFLLDTRSQRGPFVPEAVPRECPETARYVAGASAEREPRQILGATQLCHLERWLEEIAPRDAPEGGGREFVLVSTSPLFSGPRQDSPRVAFARLFRPELRDDLRDAWNAPRNRAQRDLLLRLLVRARQSGLRPLVVSGDVHESVPVVAWYCDASRAGESPRGCATSARRECEVLAYEMVTTGLSNEDFPSGMAERSMGQINEMRARATFAQLEGLSARVDGRETSSLGVEATVFQEHPVPNFGVLHFRPGATTWLNLFEARVDERGLRRRALEARWDRTRCEDLRVRSPDTDRMHVVQPVQARVFYRAVGEDE